MLGLNERVKTLAVVANGIELGSRVLKKLSGDTLNGNKMNAVEETLAVHLRNELSKKGNKSC